MLGVGAEFFRVLLQHDAAFRALFQRVHEALLVGFDFGEALGDFFLAFFEVEEARFAFFVAFGFFFDLSLHCFALTAQVGEAGFEVLVFDVEGVDSGFGGFDLVEVLVDDGGLGLSEADKVDDVREDFDETIVGRFEEVGEGEVVDAALLGHSGQF